MLALVCDVGYGFPNPRTLRIGIADIPVRIYGRKHSRGCQAWQNVAIEIPPSGAGELSDFVPIVGKPLSTARGSGTRTGSGTSDLEFGQIARDVVPGLEAL